MFSLISIIILFAEIGVASIGLIAFLHWIARAWRNPKKFFLYILIALTFLAISSQGLAGFLTNIIFILKSRELAAVPWKYLYSITPIFGFILCVSVTYLFSKKKSAWHYIILLPIACASSLIFLFTPFTLINKDGVIMPNAVSWQSILFAFESMSLHFGMVIYILNKRRVFVARKKPLGAVDVFIKAFCFLGGTYLLFILYTIADYRHPFLFVAGWVFALIFVVHYYLGTISFDAGEEFMLDPLLYVKRSLTIKLGFILNIIVWFTIIGSILLMTSLLNNTIAAYAQGGFFDDLLRKALFAQAWFLLLAVLILIFMTIFIIYFVRSLLRPLNALKEGTRILGQGNLHYRIVHVSDDEFGRLAGNFNDMASNLEKKHKEVIRLKELDKIKSQFVSTASHQLRTPLTAIRWIVSLLLKEKDNKKFDEMRYGSLLHTLYDSNLRMINLVNKLLDASKLEAQNLRLERQRVSLLELIEKQIMEMSSQIIPKGICARLCIKQQSDGEMMGDAQMLAMMLQNLISNAVHYNRTGGYVRITLKQANGLILLSIEDSGIGIKDEDSRNLFLKFYRGKEAISLKTDGSGLGLFITKSIVRVHRGKIWFKSNPKGGTAFFIKMPVT